MRSATTTSSFLWVEKSAGSLSLSHSDGQERIDILCHAQRTSRPVKRKGGTGRRKQTLFTVQSVNSHGKHTKRPYCRAQLDEVATLNTQASMPPPSRVEAALSLDPDSTIDERRAVHFYFQKTVPKIITLDQHADFWQQVVPSLTKLHPVFRYIVAAIASIHEYHERHDADKFYILALEQCNKATQVLRKSNDMEPLLHLLSCILIAAYSLLRSDLTFADQCIETGLSIPVHPHPSTTPDGSPSVSHCGASQLKSILILQSRRNLFTLWSPDIISPLASSSLDHEPLAIDPICINGPFASKSDISMCYSTIRREIVDKMLRNLPRGAYVDSSCRLARETTEQFWRYNIYFEMYWSGLPVHDVDTRLELKQFLVGFYSVYLLFFNHVFDPKTLGFDTDAIICRRIMAYTEDILTAYIQDRSDNTNVYREKCVNGALLLVGLCSRDVDMSHRTAELLQSQAGSTQGAIYWMLGVVLKVMAKLAKLKGPYRDLRGMSYSQDTDSIFVECSIDGVVRILEEPLDWDTSIAAKPPTCDINASLQTVVALFKFYNRPTVSPHTTGHVQQFLFRGYPVPLCWRGGSEHSSRKTCEMRGWSEI